MRWAGTPASFPLDQPFAHRGLHDDRTIENSSRAFAAAVAAGFGIECDVQAARDGQPVVFHDSRLDRLTDQRGWLDRRSSASLAAVSLCGRTERIPTLRQMLRDVGSVTPVLVEVKASRSRPDRFCRAIAAIVRSHPGPAAVMSFDAGIVAWFARCAPTVPRGLVVGRSDLPHLLQAMPRCRPHFLAADVSILDAPLLQRLRASCPVLTWTIRTEEQRQRATSWADQIIFEATA